MSDASLAERLAVCSWSLHPKDPADLIDQLRQLGMDKIQLALDPLRTDAKWADAGEQLADASIEVVSGMFGCEGEDYTTLDSIRRTGGIVPDKTWAANWKNIQKDIEIANALGLELVSFHAGFLPDDSGDPAHAKLASRLRQVAEAFDDAGIDLALETGQEDAATLKGFLEHVALPNLGVNFDPANMILYAKGDPVESVRILGPFLKQMHVKDAVPTKVPGQWGKEVPVGTGAVNWNALFTTLGEVEFDGYMSIEREAGDQRIPDIRTAKEFILETIREVEP